MFISIPSNHNGLLPGVVTDLKEIDQKYNNHFKIEKKSNRGDIFIQII